MQPHPKSVIALDLTIVNVALPTIGRDLHWAWPYSRRRRSALGLWGGIGAGGATIGLIAGGALTRYVGWEYILFLNVPVGAAALLLAPRIVPQGRLWGPPPL